MEKEIGQYGEEKPFVFPFNQPNAVKRIENICSLENPAEQKAGIENMLKVIITKWLKETEPAANDSAKEAQTEKPAAKAEPIVESSTEETQAEASVEEAAKVEPVVESSTEETQTEVSAKEAAKVEPVVESSTEETQTETPAEGTPLIEIESPAEETKEESTASAKEKKSLLNKILNFLKKLPLIGKLFKFLFK